MSRAIMLIFLSPAFYVVLVINYIKMDIKTYPPAGAVSTDSAKILKCPHSLRRKSTWYFGLGNKNSVCFNFRTAADSE